MPMWRCPHCGTPQAEAARCWVCRRSATACATCRHYRRSVAGKLGYCGLDARRQPLTGEEIRGCWEGWPAGTGTAMTGPPRPVASVPPSDTGRRPLAFVEVVPTSELGEGTGRQEPLAGGTLLSAAEPRWDLWGDADR